MPPKNALNKEKQSRELGPANTVVLLWDADLELKLGNLDTAQQRYTDFLIGALPPPQPGPVRVLDIGCGTGHVLGQLLQRGYQADGLVPSASLARLVRKHQEQHPGKPSRLFECRFEDFPVDENAHKYDVALFSESFQYISMDASFALLQKILKPGGRLVICDFKPRRRPRRWQFRRRHPMAEFDADTTRTLPCASAPICNWSMTAAQHHQNGGTDAR